MPSVFRCALCLAVFKNQRRIHYSGVNDNPCPGTLTVCEIAFDELVLARIVRKRTRSKRERTKFAARRKEVKLPKAIPSCAACEAFGDLCPSCRHKKMKRDWARAKSARLRSERQNAATRIAELFGGSPT